jgi:flagellar biosynthesis/type III secretory pathway M-ring protein FliF/YscJ
MDSDVHRCKGCGIVFEDVDENIDKCAKKRLYCELCLAQKNPWSKTEQKIKKRYILVTGISAFLVLIVLFTINWEKNKNDTLFEYLIVFGIGYLLVWVITSILLMPVLMRMKKPHRDQIKKEKQKYIEEIEEKKASRNTLPGE